MVVRQRGRCGSWVDIVLAEGLMKTRNDLMIAGHGLGDERIQHDHSKMHRA